jgi:glutamyl-tRNA reductase
VLKATLNHCKNITLDIDASEVIANKADAQWTYKKNAYQIKKSAVEMALKKLKNGGDAQTIIVQLGDQLTNKLLHTPFSNIKQNLHGLQ